MCSVIAIVSFYLDFNLGSIKSLWIRKVTNVVAAGVAREKEPTEIKLMS